MAGGEALKEPFTELHEILMQVRARAPRQAMAASAEALALSGRATSCGCRAVTGLGSAVCAPVSWRLHHVHALAPACMLFCVSSLWWSNCAVVFKLRGAMLQLAGCPPCRWPAAAAPALAFVTPGSAGCPSGMCPTCRPGRRRRSALPAPARPRAGARAEPGAGAGVGGREPGAAARARRARRRGLRVPAAPPALPAHAAAAGRAHAARAALPRSAALRLGCAALSCHADGSTHRRVQKQDSCSSA